MTFLPNLQYSDHLCRWHSIRCRIALAANQSLNGSASPVPAITTITDRRLCNTRTVPICAAVGRTSLYCGACYRGFISVNSVLPW
jgi:hypothetical protein